MKLLIGLLVFMYLIIISIAVLTAYWLKERYEKVRKGTKRRGKRSEPRLGKNL